MNSDIRDRGRSLPEEDGLSPYSAQIPATRLTRNRSFGQINFAEAEFRMEAIEDRAESQFALCFEPGTFILNTSGLVFGVIWIEVGGQKFPFNRWTDFPVIILGWWLQSLVDLLGHTKELVRCSFMDG